MMGAVWKSGDWHYKLGEGLCTLEQYSIILCFYQLINVHFCSAILRVLSLPGLVLLLDSAQYHVTPFKFSV